jgi:hypothetical protein
MPLCVMPCFAGEAQRKALGREARLKLIRSPGLAPISGHLLGEGVEVHLRATLKSLRDSVFGGAEPLKHDLLPRVLRYEARRDPRLTKKGRALAQA